MAEYKEYRSLNETYYPLNESYKAILTLDKKLTEENIPHELWRLNDGWKIAYPTQENCRFDVIEHCGSYGNEQDLMEAMGGYLEDVEGHLTVEEALEMFKEVHNGRSES